MANSSRNTFWVLEVHFRISWNENFKKDSSGKIILNWVFPCAGHWEGYKLTKKSPLCISWKKTSLWVHTALGAWLSECWLDSSFQKFPYSVMWWRVWILFLGRPQSSKRARTGIYILIIQSRWTKMRKRGMDRMLRELRGMINLS